MTVSDTPVTSARAWGGALLAAATGALVAVALFFSGGSDDGRLLWIGGGAVLVAGIGLAAVCLGLVPVPDRTAAPALALLAALALWSGLSILWSLEPDRSWRYFNRDLSYVAFALAGALVGALVPRAPRRVALALAVLLAAVVVWALAGKVFPALSPDVTRSARLRSPVGYWNALAVLGVMALILALWLARRRALRAAGTVLAYVSLVAIVLTYSRGGIAIALVAVVLWLTWVRPLLEGLTTLALAGVAAFGVSAWALTRPALVQEAQPLEPRIEDGRVFGVLLVAVAALVWGLAHALARSRALERLPESRRRTLTRSALVAIAALVLAAATVSIARAGGPVEWAEARVKEFANPISASLPERSGRLTAVSSNHRWTWWGEAWESFRERPMEGTGAGSFGLAHRVYRTTYAPPAREPHSLPLQVLAETGLPGFLLLVGFAVAVVLATRLTLGRLRDEDRSAGVALLVCAVAFALHVLIDNGWDYVAAAAPVFVIIGVLVSGGPAGGRRGARRRWLPAVGAIALAVSALFSLASPWLADRRVDDAVAAIADGTPAKAVESAEAAHDLNPLSVDPLLVWAGAEVVRGDVREARRLYARAVELQPLDPETWFQLGEFERTIARDCYAAYAYLNRSYTLDRYGPAGERGGALDKARAAVNAGRARC